MRRSHVLLLALLLSAGCSGGVEDRRPVALLGGSFADSPWPNDLFLRNGRLRVGTLPLPGDPVALRNLSAAIAEEDGFPVRTSIFFPTAGGKDVQGPLSGTARLLDLTDGTAVPEAPEGLPLFYRADTRELVAMTTATLVLQEGHTYACLLDPATVLPSGAMEEALRGGGSWGRVYAPLAAYLRSRGIPLASVGAATVFTVGRPTRVLYAMRSRLEAEPFPVARVDRVVTGPALDEFFGHPTTTRSGWGDPAGVVHESIGAVVLGTFTSPYYLTGGGTHLGTIVLDEAGSPVPQGTTVVPFLLAIPRGGGASLAGVPMMIFQHGLNQGRGQVTAVANDYARAGYATIGIDALWHGDRRPGAIDQVHNLTGAPGGDGMADQDPFGASFFFFNLSGDAAEGIQAMDGRPVRDNLRQAALDVMQLVRLVLAGDLSAVAASDPSLAGLTLDGSHLVYTGESFGSILGAIVTAVDPHLQATVLSVGGAGIFLPIFADSPWFAKLLEPLLKSLFDRALEVTDPSVLPAEAERTLSLLQSVLEPGDPVAFARKIAREPAAFPKSLLLLQAFYDELIPNQGGELLAAAAGATQVLIPGHTHALRYVDLPSASAPFSDNRNGATVAVVDLFPATHGMYTGFHDDRDYETGFPPFVKLPVPIPIDNPTEYDHALATGFADSFRSTGTPAVVAPPD